MDIGLRGGWSLNKFLRETDERWNLTWVGMIKISRTSIGKSLAFFFKVFFTVPRGRATSSSNLSWAELLPFFSNFSRPRRPAPRLLMVHIHLHTNLTVGEIAFQTWMKPYSCALQHFHAASVCRLADILLSTEKKNEYITCEKKMYIFKTFANLTTMMGHKKNQYSWIFKLCSNIFFDSTQTWLKLSKYF